jgi:hypothetical protein
MMQILSCRVSWLTDIIKLIIIATTLMLQELINEERFQQYDILEEILVTQQKTVLKW